jgi:hypothetical protein
VNATERPDTGDVQRTLDREVELLTSAVRLVATGGAPSTTVAGLRLAEAAMAIVAPIAREQGVVMDMLWGPDERGCDVRVRGRQGEG